MQENGHLEEAILGSLQVDQRTPLAQRLVGRFQQLHNPETGDAVIERRAIVGDAIYEIRQFLPERLYLFDLRRPHVPAAVIHQKIVETLPGGNVYALIVKLHFLIRLKVIPHQHFLLATKERRAHFYWR